MRVYLGAAPGVGKTYTMVEEARRRAERGTDVIVGFVETHGRVHTAALLGRLEVLPRRQVTYRGGTFEEMDTEAILARHPELVLVDELAHTNIPHGRHTKRWQDVQELLAAGIDVLSTVNIQHLESLNDVVEAVTGVPQRETVPDEVVRRAEQVELVDMTPEALRRRMAHGNIYPPDRVDAALGNYFRLGNLTALRELALLWMADKVDEQLDSYRAQHGISRGWETRERVVIALSGGPEGETLIRRGARIAARATGGELCAVYVVPSDGLLAGDAGALQRQRDLVEDLGGSYHQVVGHHIPDALFDFARGVNATQLVLGASRRTWIGTVLGGRGVAAEVTRRAGPIDVHIVSHDAAGRGRRLPEFGGHLSVRRRLTGTALAAVALPAVT
ncbi:MAG: universal stress protein, partial [Frankia sp.]